MGFIVDIFTSSQDRKAQTKAADKAAAASTAATDKSIALQKSMFDTMWSGTAVQRAAGDAATRQMAALMGLDLGAVGQPASGVGSAQLNPGQSTPGYGSPSFPGGGVFGGDDFRLSAQPNALAMGVGGGMVQDFEGPGNALGSAQFGAGQQVPSGGAAITQAPGGAQTTAAPANALSPQTDWLRNTPGYQFNFDEGMRALNTGLAGQGRLQSGDASREAIRYGQNYGDRIYGDQWNRLAGIAGAGQTAQSQGQQAGQNYANNGSNALMWNAGNQMQSSYNKGNANSGFWGSVSGAFNNAFPGGF